MEISAALRVTNWKGLTFSPEGIPVSPFLRLESGKGRQTSAIFGLNSRDSLAYFDPDTCSWKTFQATFLSGLETYSETWPDSGTMRNGVVTELRTSAPAISGNESSSWPTAMTYTRREDGESCGNHPGATDSLTGATINWGTPSAHERAQDPRQVDHGIQLANQADTWQTPRKQSALDSGPSRIGCKEDIQTQAEHWQTPQARDYRS
jgi:hypothetical protein